MLKVITRSFSWESNIQLHFIREKKNIIYRLLQKIFLKIKCIAPDPEKRNAASFLFMSNKFSMVIKAQICFPRLKIIEKQRNKEVRIKKKF